VKVEAIWCGTQETHEFTALMLGETPGSTFGRGKTRHSTRKYVATKPLHT